MSIVFAKKGGSRMPSNGNSSTGTGSGNGGPGGGRKS